MGASVRVLLFGPARESLGTDRVDVALGNDARSLPWLIAQLRAAHPRLTPILATSRFAVNGEYADPRRQRLRSGDEIAVHPPYSGG